MKRFGKLALICLVAIMVMLPATQTFAQDEVIQSSDISLQKLQQLFKAALMTAEIEGDVLVVKGDSGFKMNIKIYSPRKLIAYFLFFNLKDNISQADKLQAIQALNNDMLFARYSIYLDKGLLVDYFVSYEDGIPAKLVVRSAKMLEEAGIGGIRKHCLSLMR